jgi:hypothetical protein
MTTTSGKMLTPMAGHQIDAPGSVNYGVLLQGTLVLDTTGRSSDGYAVWCVGDGALADKNPVWAAYHP